MSAKQGIKHGGVQRIILNSQFSSHMLLRTISGAAGQGVYVHSSGSHSLFELHGSGGLVFDYGSKQPARWETSSATLDRTALRQRLKPYSRN